MSTDVPRAEQAQRGQRQEQVAERTREQDRRVQV